MQLMVKAARTRFSNLADKVEAGGRRVVLVLDVDLIKTIEAYRRPRYEIRDSAEFGSSG